MNNKLNQSRVLLLAAVICTTTFWASNAFAENWSITELHYQYGNLKKPYQGGGSAADTGGTSVLTFQNTSGWKYGDVFFFADYSKYGKTDVETENSVLANDEIYAELYANFSLKKMTGYEFNLGIIDDIGLVAGLNFAPEVDALYYLPGFRLVFDLPGFRFANLDITARIQDGTSKFSVKEKDSYMLDFSWAYPFAIANTRWSIEGHVEYTHMAEQSMTGIPIENRESWLLAQVQFRLDVGHFWDSPDQLFFGMEYQYWRNKLGDPDTDESVPQLLIAWRF